MRVRITVDSATPEQVFEYTRAFKQALNRHAGLPGQVTDAPTVDVVGIGMTWTSPALTEEQAGTVLDLVASRP